MCPLFESSLEPGLKRVTEPLANLRVSARVYDVEGGAIFAKNSTFVFFDGFAWTRACGFRPRLWLLVNSKLPFWVVLTRLTFMGGRDMSAIASSYMQIFLSFDFNKIASWNIERIS